MARQLTDKQEKFAQLVVDGESQAESYRQAYDASNMTDSATGVEASRTAALPHVSLRINQLRDELEEMRLWTRLDSIKTLKEVAEEKGEGFKNSDRVAAVKALNSMNGWDKQTIDHTSSDGTMTAPSRIELVAPTVKDDN